MSSPTRIFAFFVALFFALGITHPSALAGTGYADYQTARTIAMRSEESNNRVINVPGRGEMTFYAQTNPIWAEMRYESPGSRARRRFGGSGCCPTSIAIAIANTVPLTDLGKISPYAAPKAGAFGITAKEMNPMLVNPNVGMYWLSTAEDFQAYLPLVIGQYAAGNNPGRTPYRAAPKPSEQISEAVGTKIHFLPTVCGYYGLYCLKVGSSQMDKWSAMVRYGAVGVALASGSSPLCGDNGHYVDIVAVDETYVYILDPQDIQIYPRDRHGIIEVLESGLIRVRLTDYKQLCLSSLHMLYNQETNAKLIQNRVDLTAKQ